MPDSKIYFTHSVQLNPFLWTFNECIQCFEVVWNPILNCTFESLQSICGPAETKTIEATKQHWRIFTCNWFHFSRNETFTTSIMQFYLQEHPTEDSVLKFCDPCDWTSGFPDLHLHGRPGASRKIDANWHGYFGPSTRQTVKIGRFLS